MLELNARNTFLRMVEDSFSEWWNKIDKSLFE